MPPRGRAPGLKRGRHNLPYWMAKQVVRDPMGFPDTCVPLPPDASDDELAELCQQHTARLREHIARTQQEEPAAVKTRYDGSVMSACRIYQEHPLSRFHGVKFSTRRTYITCLNRLEATVGRRLIRNVTVLDVQHWYDQWRKPEMEGDGERVDRAHDTVAMLRTVLRFCAALRIPECKVLADELKLVQFEKGGAREQELTYAHATAFIRKALELGAKGVRWMPADRAHAMAIGVAAQFELLLRQKDIIGEWAPIDARRRAPTDLIAVDGDGERWNGYFTWERVPGWRWRMKTSKSKYRAGVEFDLTKYTLLFPLLEAVPLEQRKGAIVKGENGLPVRQSSYAKWFRKIARAAGIPDEVWNMDARAGGATEAEEAGATLEAIQQALTHTHGTTSLRYIRRRAKKAAEVAEARAASRLASQGGSDGTA